MEIAKAILERAGLAIAAAAAGAAIATPFAREKQKKEDNELIEFAHKEGLKKGAKLGAEEAAKVFIYPVLAECSIAYYMARADGNVSKEEKRILDQSFGELIKKESIPEPIIKEIKKIQSKKDIDFEFVKHYLNKIDIKGLADIKKTIVEIAKATEGVSEEEKVVINEFESYINERKELLAVKQEDFNPESTQNLETYIENFVPEYKIMAANSEFSLKRKALDTEFALKTKLNKKEIGLLTVAVFLQCIRIYGINKITEKEPAGKGKKEDFLHEKQDQLLQKFNPDEERSKRYYASLEQIVSTTGVPFDTTQSEKYKIFSKPKGGKGANHRFSTLGHDPIIGLVIGTTNIMTNTITTVTDETYIPSTYHVKYSSDFKKPVVTQRASFAKAIGKSVERSKEDLTPLCAAIIKQLIHIATDMYTPTGIQLPGANMVLSRASAEQLTTYVSSGDLIKLGTSAGLTELINKIIEILHGVLLLEKSDQIYTKLNQVKTRKIVDYSMAIATGSNIIATIFDGQIQDLDFGGLLVLMRRYFTDIDFIYQVRKEFLMSGLKDL